MRKTVLATLIATAFATPSFAVTVDDADGSYFGLAGGYEISDNDRDAKNGYGAQATFGIPLKDLAGAVELNYWDAGRDRALDGKKDYQTALMVNYVQDLAAFSLFKPFASVGIGGVQEDVLGEKHTHAAIDAGVGTLIALPWHKLAIRTEARALGQDNQRKSAPGNEDFILDYRVLFGLQVPLMMAAAPTAAPAAAEPKPLVGCELQVVDPVTGRSNCAADSDHDGVPDGIDQCPGTEPGTVVNAVGCPAVTEPAPSAALPAPVGELEYVTFSDNKSAIDAESKAKLDKLAATLAADATMKVEIEGRTDSRGSAAYNLVLGAQRAEAVRQYLVSKGIDAARLSTISFGKSKPVASNSTAAGRRENRSARFRIIK